MIKISNPILPNKELIKNAIDDIWNTGLISNFGKYAQLFENKVKEFVGCPYVLAISSCDTALKLSIATMRTSQIAIPTFTFNSTYMAAKWNDCNIHLLDIDPNTLLVDLNTIENKAKEGVKNFVLVNVFGNLYDISSINFLKNKYNLNIIFDSAHSFGSSYFGKKSGNLGYLECFSFSPTKLITSGEGGIICLNDEKTYEELKRRRNYGFIGDYNSKYQGCNGKINEISAAIGAYSVDIYSEIFDKKLKIVQEIKNNLKNHKFQKITEGVVSTYKDLILLSLNNQDKIIKEFEEKQIQWKKYFLPLHKHDFIKNINPHTTNCPNANEVYENSMCIPAHANLTKDEIHEIVTILQNNT